MKRRYLIIGLWGIYLICLTAYLLYGGIFQTIDTITMMYRTRILGTERISYPVRIYWRVLFSVLVAIGQIVAGSLGLSCVVRTPDERKFKSLVISVLSIELFTIARDILLCSVRATTFMYFHIGLLLIIFAQTWMVFQNEEDNGRKEFFPFIRALIRCRKG